MNTIKIYLAESGRVADLRKDFPLYKGQFNDKLLNVLVPTSILAPQFELQHYIGQMSGATAPTDEALNNFVAANTYPTRSAEQGDIIEFYNSTTQLFFIYTYNNDDWASTQVDSFGTLNTIAGTSVKIGMTATKPNGTIYESKSYFMRYLKTLTYQNVEYALYERKLPKEFTSFVGQGQNAPTLVINVVNVDTENNAVTSIITSQTCSLDVMASNMLDQDESIETSDLELLEAEVNTLSAEIDLKQDKTDQTLNTTSKQVVGAINELDLQVDANTTQVATNTGDISSLDTRVTALEQQDATEETYIGKMTGTTLPSDAELDAFVLSTAGRETQGGDVVMFVLEVTGGTDKNYKYKYSSITNSWSGYEIPATEPASNTDMGIVQGSYGSDKNTQVNIVGGDIKNIYVKDNSNNLRDIAEYTNATSASMTNILNGTTAVGKATRADQDGNGNNIAQTYLTQTAGATKQQLYDYALPRAFNDVSYLNSTGYQLTIPTGTSPIFTAQSSAVGYTQLFSAEKPIENAQFELTNKNSYETDIFLTASINCNVSFRLTTEIYQNNAWTTLNIEVSTQTQLIADQVQKLVFASQFNYIQGIINVASGDKLRQTLEVLTTESTATTFNVYSNETYPSDFILNTTSQIIYLADETGYLGELPQMILTGTRDASTFKISFELPSTFVIEEGIQCYFELSYPYATFTPNDHILITQGVQTLLLKTPYNFKTAVTSSLLELKPVMVSNLSEVLLVFTGVFREINGTLCVVADVANTIDLMNKANPRGTGSISINRKASTNVGVKSVAMGDDNSATAAASVAFGQGNSSSGQASTAEGFYTEASGLASHAEGNYSKATGNYSHAEGNYSKATKQAAHAEGSNCYATGNNCHAEGNYSKADALSGNSHAEGEHTQSSGEAAHAEGFWTFTHTNSIGGHAEGGFTSVYGRYGHAEGYYTTSQGVSQHVFGEYNVLDNNGTATTRGDYVEIVGNGTAENARSNARTLDWSGNEYLAGNLQAAGLTDGTTTKTMSQILAGGGGTKYQHNIKLRFSINPTWNDSSSQVVDTTALITFIDDDDKKITRSNIGSRVFQKMGISSSNRYYLNTRDKFIYDSQTGSILEKIIYCSGALYIDAYNSPISYIGIEPFKLWKYDVANNTYTGGSMGMASSLIATIIEVEDLVVEI